MAIKVFEKEYPEQFLTIQYTLEIVELKKLGRDSLRITGRLVPSWVHFEDEDLEKFDKYKDEFDEMKKAADAFVKRSPQEVEEKKAFGIVFEVITDDFDASRYLRGDDGDEGNI